MSKGDETRTRVLVQTGGLMNRTGYLATPLSAILHAVDLQKGGLYNHFSSKEELALEAFGTNAEILGAHLGAIARSHGDPFEVLGRLIDASLDVAAGRVVPGGCPVLNAGTEADDGFEPLRLAAARSADALRRFFLLPLHRLERAGRLVPGTDVDSLALVLVSAVEGGILWARVTHDADGQASMVRTLRSLVATQIVP